ncbi:hypothetical protein WJX79_001534 [Trebouxia sp. C0005]
MTSCNGLQTEVIKSHGCICLTGPAIEGIAAAALSFLQSPQKGVPACRRTLLGNIDTSASIIGTATSFPATCSWSKEQLNCHERSSVILQQAESKLGTHFRPHVTLVTKEELAACTVGRPHLLQDFQLLDQAAFFPVGLAIADTTAAVHTWAAASPETSAEKDHPKDLSSRGQQSQTQPEASQMETQLNTQINAQPESSIGSAPASAATSIGLLHTGYIASVNCCRPPHFSWMSDKLYRCARLHITPDCQQHG